MLLFFVCVFYYNLISWLFSTNLKTITPLMLNNYLFFMFCLLKFWKWAVIMWMFKNQNWTLLTLRITFVSLKMWSYLKMINIQGFFFHKSSAILMVYFKLFISVCWRLVPLFLIQNMVMWSLKIYFWTVWGGMYFFLHYLKRWSCRLKYKLWPDSVHFIVRVQRRLLIHLSWFKKHIYSLKK